MSDRLYVVVRADLPIGLQMAQLGHAAYRFGVVFPNFDVGENIVILHAKDEFQLAMLIAKASFAAPLRMTAFFEPDVGGELTAAAFEGKAKKILRSLPLAFSAPRCASDATDRTEGTGKA